MSSPGLYRGGHRVTGTPKPRPERPRRITRSRLEDVTLAELARVYRLAQLITVARAVREVLSAVGALLWLAMVAHLLVRWWTR